MMRKGDGRMGVRTNTEQYSGWTCPTDLNAPEGTVDVYIVDVYGDGIELACKDGAEAEALLALIVKRSQNVELVE